jgi:hypothetical protein
MYMNGQTKELGISFCLTKPAMELNLDQQLQLLELGLFLHIQDPNQEFKRSIC